MLQLRSSRNTEDNFWVFFTLLHLLKVQDHINMHWTLLTNKGADYYFQC